MNQSVSRTNSLPDYIYCSPSFLVEIFKRVLEEHNPINHCQNECGQAIECTPENCSRWKESWERQKEFGNSFENEEEAYGDYHYEGHNWHHDLGPESIQLIPQDIDAWTGSEWHGINKHFGKSYSKTDPTTHIDKARYFLTVCYSTGTGHEWYATYGYDEETNYISCWAD